MHLGCKNMIGGSYGSLFGDGTYSENIYVGGVLVQPVASYQPTWDLMPTMTAQATSGFTVTDNGNYGAGFEAWRVFDGLNGGINGPNIYRIAGTTGRIYIQFKEPTPIGGYSIQTNTNSGANAPTQWNLYGSMTGTWGDEKALLDSRSVAAWANGEKRTFLLAAPSAAYPYLMLDILACGASSNNTIGEMEIFPAPMENVIVITGAATVAPDAETGAAGFSGNNLVMDGAGSSLTPTVNCKGLLGFLTGKAVFLNGAKMHMDRMGKAGNFGNLTAYTLAPASIRRKLKKTLHDLYTVQGEGAAGAAPVYQPTANFSALYGTTPAAAGAMQTGGGGPGAVACHSVPMTGARAGKGGPCCGGAAGAILIAANQGAQVAVTDSGDYGGPAGPVIAVGGVSNTSGGGTPGDTVGAPYQGSAALGGGGGLLMLFAGGGVSIGAGCIGSADGSPGGNASGFTYNIGASGAGGGLVCIVVPPGLYSNAGTVRAAGGAPGSGGFGGNNVGGGLGSVNIFYYVE